jgi:hypothetical protein
VGIEVRCEGWDVTRERVEGQETDEEGDGDDPEECRCPDDGVQYSGT